MAHQEQTIYAGLRDKASSALIMIHGRGGSAEDILSLAPHLQVKDYLLAAPQATNYSWYPQSFLAPPANNEPWLSSAIDTIDKLVTSIGNQGLPMDRIYLLGFSQGACLTLEFAARHAARFGGIAAFTGGLIGDKIYEQNYHGDFGGTPIFLGTANPDPHVPVERVQATNAILQKMGASTTLKIYPGMGHTISQDEIDQANTLLFKP